MDGKLIELRQISLNELRELITDSIRAEIANLNKTGNIKDLLTREEVSELLNISLVSLYNHTKEGFIQSYKIGGRVLYKREDVLAALEKVKNLKYKRN